MKKIILVSNRLPVTIERKEGQFSFTPSVGGLATGLSSVSKNYECIWLGFPGIVSNELNEEETNIVSQKLARDFKSYPVFLNSLEIKNYYNGFSNKTIWPLFHYFQYHTNYDSQTWEYYKSVNEKFLERLIKLVEEDDIVWVHDYQLMLLPKMIKEKIPSARVGFFFAYPFSIFGDF